MALIEEPQREALPHARYRAPAGEGLGLVRLGCADEIQLQVKHQTGVGVDQREVQRHTLMDGGLGKRCSPARPVRHSGELFAALRQMILAVGLLDSSESRRACAHERPPAPQEVTGRMPLSGIDVGLGQHAAAEEHRHRMGIDCIVLGLTAMHRLQIEGMAQDAGKPRGGAEVGQPVPGQETFDAHDQSVSVRGTRLQERLGGRFHMAVEQELSILVEDAQRHRAHVQVEATVQLVGLRGDAPEVSSSVGGVCCPGASRPPWGAEEGTSISIKGTEATASSVRSAPAFGSGSCPALSMLPDFPLRPAITVLESAL